MNYLPITEAASELNITENKLIQLGAEGEIDIYVIPSPTWTLKASSVQKFTFQNGDEGGVLIEGELTGLALTLLRLKVAPMLLESYRHHAEDTQVEGFTYTDQRTGNLTLLQPNMASPIYMRDCCLVVRDADLRRQRKRPNSPKSNDVSCTSEALSFQVPQPAPIAEPLKAISPNQKLLRMSDLVDMTGLSKSSIYSYIKQGTFPAQEASRGGRASFWQRDSVEAWIAGTWELSTDGK